MIGHNPRIVTTSWDDGDPSDLRIAELLSFRNLPGTFYVPLNGYQGKQRLANSDLRALCVEGFEIGAHTISHKTLPRLTPTELSYEIRTCKTMLEQTLGHEVLMFCYPNGRYDADVRQHVKDAGYVGARTTRMLSVKTYFLAFQMPTSLQAYPHAKAAYMRNLGRARSVSTGLKYITRLSHLKTWVDLGKRLFDDVLEHGGIWHLYGHSWEIEELGIWNDLSKMLDYVSHRDRVTYASNGQLLANRGISTK